MTAHPDSHTIHAIIRPAQLVDADALRATCWPDRPLTSVSELIHRTEKMALRQRGLGVVAVYDGTPRGFGMLTVWPRAAEISDLIVNVDCRGQGIGTQIITYLTDAARSLKVETLEIGVALSNPRALALYRRLEFNDQRIIEIDLGLGPEPVLYLTKTLAAH